MTSPLHSPPPIRWPAEAIWEAVAPVLPGFTVEVLPEIDSTNSELMRRHKAAAKARSAVLLVAGRQSAGRGRMGRVWLDAAAGGHCSGAESDSVLFSLGLPLLDGSNSGGSGLSLAVGVCVAEALQDLVDENHGTFSSGSGLRIGLKWPNDVWLRQASDNSERKLAGILVETASAHTERYAVIGVGVNLQVPPGLLPKNSSPLHSFAPQAAAGLREVCPGVQPADVLRRVLPRLAQALRLFESAGFAPFQPRFAACDMLAGRDVELSSGSDGVACGVDASGALQVRSGNGWESVSSNEVSVRPQGAKAC